MSKTGMHLDSLYELLKAKEQAVEAKFHSVVANERRLRNLLSELDQQERKADATIAEETSVRQVGADLAWGRWIGEQRKMLNMNLANVLVQKEAILNDMREAFGKRTALGRIVDFETQKLSRKRTNHAQASLDVLVSLVGNNIS